AGAPLEEIGALRRTEREAIDAADEFLERVRSALHLETGHEGDRLVLEQQPSIARWFGFADEPGLSAVDGLMRTVFEHGRQVEHVTRAALDRVVRGSTEADAEGDWDGDELTAEGVLRALVHAARAGGVRALAPATLDRIERAAVPDPVAWTPGVREAFLELLRSGDDGVRALETLDRLGRLSRYLPAWTQVRCRPQRDPYHRSTVDIHLLEALEGMARLLDGDPAADPL